MKASVADVREKREQRNLRYVKLCDDERHRSTSRRLRMIDSVRPDIGTTNREDFTSGHTFI